MQAIVFNDPLRGFV